MAPWEGIANSEWTSHWGCLLGPESVQHSWAWCDLISGWTAWRLSPWDQGHRPWDGDTHVSAPLSERKQQKSSGKAGPPDGICASVPTHDPLTVDQYLISLVSFVFVANNPHSQKKERKTSDALADLHLSKVAAEPLLQLMHRADKFTKKRARSHLIH